MAPHLTVVILCLYDAWEFGGFGSIGYNASKGPFTFDDPFV